MDGGKVKYDRILRRSIHFSSLHSGGSLGGRVTEGTSAAATLFFQLFCQQSELFYTKMVIFSATGPDKSQSGYVNSVRRRPQDFT